MCIRDSRRNCLRSTLGPTSPSSGHTRARIPLQTPHSRRSRRPHHLPRSVRHAPEPLPPVERLPDLAVVAVCARAPSSPGSWPGYVRLPARTRITAAGQWPPPASGRGLDRDRMATHSGWHCLFLHSGIGAANHPPRTGTTPDRSRTDIRLDDQHSMTRGGHRASPAHLNHAFPRQKRVDNVCIT